MFFITLSISVMNKDKIIFEPYIGDNICLILR
jgi:hypothetical protein